MKIDFKNKKKLQIVLFVMIAVITLGVGYAAISAVNLIVNGNATASANQNNFSVVFKSASITTGTGIASINNQDATIAYFDVSGLAAQGDMAVATYTIKNESNGVGASVGLKVENSNSEYFQVTERVEDNKLQAGDTTTATVTVQMIKTPIEENVTTTITGTLTASPLENANAAGGTSAIATPIPGPVSFSTDSWATIQKAVQDDNTSNYNIGDTRVVTIGGQNYTLRLANKSTSEKCDDEDYSETACGFVIEFADIVTVMQMNSERTTDGLYPATLVYDYLKNTLYEQLPTDLKNVIIPTRVISLRVPYYYESITTIDNLYLLSQVEILGGTENGGMDGFSSELDYYYIMGYENETCNYYPNCSRSYKLGILKQYNGVNTRWWIRHANNSGGVDGAFSTVNEIKDTIPTNSTLANESFGVAPAFRIG